MPTTPGGAEARFPGFDVLGQARYWDDTTKAVVMARLRPREAVSFFTAEEEPTARALFDRLLGQDDEPRVPVFDLVDARLAEEPGDGYRFADMPEDEVAWRRSIANLDAEARARHGRPFHDLDRLEQSAVLDVVRTTDGEWRGLPASRVFALWLRYCCEAFYSHPWAWNEIGFGGPAYPRGYVNLGLGKREHWEVPDRHPRDPIPLVNEAEAARARAEASATDPGDDGDTAGEGEGGGEARHGERTP